MGEFLNNTTQSSLWNNYKRLTTEVRTNHLPPLESEDGIARTDEAKAETLSKQFFPRRTDGPTDTTAYWTWKANPRTRTINEVITYAELWDTIMWRPGFKRPGPDGIFNRTLQMLLPYYVLSLQACLNSCMTSGYFPKRLREGTTIPVYKQGKEPQLRTSYRPLTMLSMIGKTFEKILQVRISTHLEQTNKLDPHQYGFRKGRTTQTPLFRLVDQIYDGYKTQRSTAVVSLDIASAYDSVHRDILMNRLVEMGLSDNILMTLDSFLKERRYNISIDNRTEHEFLPERGIPQGSPLSPTLFLCYINSLPEVLPESFEVQMFADDVVVSKQYQKQDDVVGDFNIGLRAIEQWIQTSHLALSPGKCKYTLFSRLQGHTTPPLTLGQTDLHPERDLKYLGVHLDQRLTFNKHFGYTRRKCTQRLMTIKRISLTRKGLHPLLTRRVFLSTVPPILYYGYEAWIAEFTKNKWIQMSTQLFRLGSIWIMGLHRTTSATAAIGISGLTPPHIQLLKRILRLPKRLGQEITLSEQSESPIHHSPRDTYHLTTRRLRQELDRGVPSLRPRMTPEARLSSQYCMTPEIDQYINMRTQKEWDKADTYRISNFDFDPVTDRDWYRGLTRHQVRIASRFITGHISTQAYLSRFHLTDSNVCRLCQEAKETRSHLILDCLIASQCVRSVLQDIPVTGLRQLSDISLTKTELCALVAWWDSIATMLP